MKILITDGLSKEGLEILRSEPEIEVEEKKGITKMAFYWIKESIKQSKKDYEIVR